MKDFLKEKHSNSQQGEAAIAPSFENSYPQNYSIAAENLLLERPQKCLLAIGGVIIIEVPTPEIDFGLEGMRPPGCHSRP